MLGGIIVIERSGIDGAKFPLTVRNCLLGRDKDCDIIINHTNVSNHGKMESEFDCRLCGKSEKKITHRHLPCEKSKHARDIKLALNIEIENDPPFLSNFICESCRLKLVRWRKDVNKNKKAKINIEVVEIESAISCPSHNQTVLGKEDRVLLSICVDSDLNCRIIVLEKVVKFENILENSTSINDASIVEKLMNKISCMKVCPGNDDFSDICRYRFPSTLAKFRNTEDILIASEEHLAHRTTIRTVACGMLCDSQQERCSNCQVFRPNLFMQRSRMKTIHQKQS
ncbi:unnamed protein product [Mytilus edulis]|uniref:ZAD domain-containing protein n=1 Tax=Mytilus edulis TaxID=6550 RepID=A0A8S3QCL9_MYTED|nr:unnamed protein product [Mytilus edulis]